MFGAREAEGTGSSSHLAGWTTKQKQNQTEQKPTQSNPNVRNYKARSREQGTKDKTLLSHQRNPHLG